jgi:Flp pilus assembly protein TadG
MKFQASQKGQVLVLMVLGLLGLLALTALAIDGGNVFADRRNAQNAVDNASYAAALAWVKDQSYQPAGDAIITGNGYSNASSTWSYSTSNATCISGAPGILITVSMDTTVQTYFASLIGWNQLNNHVTAQSRGCKTIRAPLFPGQAIVGLRPSGDAFYTNGDAGWILKGGGLFANANAQGKDNKVFLVDPGEAVSVVGTGSDFPDDVPVITGAQPVAFPSGAQAMMPPVPAMCGGTGPNENAYIVNELPDADTTFSNGVYCIMNGVEKSPTSASYHIDNATLYFVNPFPELKFASGGGFYGNAPTGGPYADYVIIVAMPANPDPNNCSTYFELRGNGAGDLVGTVLAPHACIDYRGNPGASTIGQVIGFEVTTLGTSDVYIDYNEPDTGQGPQPATVELLK